MLDDDLALKAEHLSKRFRLTGAEQPTLTGRLFGWNRLQHTWFDAVDDVSFEIGRGQMLGIVGRNGSGKSTLLRCLAGIYRPSTGAVYSRGRVGALLELGAGFVPQLSGRENVYFNAAVHGFTPQETDGIMDQVIEMAGIGEFIDQPLELYSSGMKARLGFSVTVHLEPDVLLADEITSVGDIAFARKCMRHFRRLRKKGVTVVLVSHNLGMIEESADKVLWLDRGKMRGFGGSYETVREYRDAAISTKRTDETDGLVLTLISDDGSSFGYSGGRLRVETKLGDVHLDRSSSTLVRVELKYEKSRLPFLIESPVDIGNDPALAVEIDPLPLPPGHYGISVQLLQHDVCVAEGTEVLRVRPAETDTFDRPHRMDATVRAVH